MFDILLDEPDPGPSTLPGKRRQEAGLENSAEFLAADKKNSPAQENPTALNEYLEWLGVPEGKPQNRLDKAWWAENRLEILEEVEWFESTISEIEDLREAGLENSADDLDVQLWLTRAKRRAGRLWAIGQQEQAEDLEAEIWDVERDNAGPGRGYELPLGPGG